MADDKIAVSIDAFTKQAKAAGLDEKELAVLQNIIKPCIDQRMS